MAGLQPGMASTGCLGLPGLHAKVIGPVPSSHTVAHDGGSPHIARAWCRVKAPPLIHKDVPDPAGREHGRAAHPLEHPLKVVSEGGGQLEGLALPVTEEVWQLPTAQHRVAMQQVGMHELAKLIRQPGYHGLSMPPVLVLVVGQLQPELPPLPHCYPVPHAPAQPTLLVQAPILHEHLQAPDAGQPVWRQVPTHAAGQAGIMQEPGCSKATGLHCSRHSLHGRNPELLNI